MLLRRVDSCDDNLADMKLCFKTKRMSDTAEVQRLLDEVRGASLCLRT